MKQVPRQDQHARYLWRKMLTNANREGEKVTESLSDPDAILSQRQGRKLARESLRPPYNSEAVSVKPMASAWTKNSS